MTGDASQAIEQYWGRSGLADAIFAALQAAGKDLDQVTVDDLAPLDQFHAGGKGATLALARLARLEPGTRVLDVGGGLGGPARTLAVEFSCDVTVLDLTRDYLAAGEALTERLGLTGRVRFQHGNALKVPFPDGSFDLVWTQNSGMQIQDKRALYHEFHRVLRPGGRLATQEPAAGGNGPTHFPLMWARDASTSFLATPDELRQIILDAGFAEVAWKEVAPQPLGVPPAATAAAPLTLQQIVMGAELDDIQRANARNRDEDRLRAIQGIFLKPSS